MEAKRIGLDVSKSLFEVHGVDQRGQVVLRRSVPSAQLQETFAHLSPCVVGLESCGTAHRWGQQLASLGHEVRLLPPHSIAPYRGCFEQGASHAQIICEALGRCSTPYTRVKTPKRGLGLFPFPTLLAGLGRVVRG